MSNQLRLLTMTVVVYLACSAAVLAQTTAFTYQGKLSDGGTPANGTYDLQFKLYDALANGNLQGSPNTVTITGQQVTNGVFTVQVDFGPDAFPGAARFLEIAVKHPGDASFTPLTPRQPVTSTPYAMRSLRAEGIFFGADRVFGVTGTPLNPPTNTFAGLRAGESTTPHAGTLDGNHNSFFGNRAGRQNDLGALNSFFGSGAGESNRAGKSNSFFGVSAGANNTSGNSNSSFGSAAGANNTSGLTNSFFGASAGLSNTVEQINTFLGAFSDGAPGVSNATAIGSFAKVTQSNSLVLGSINGVNGADSNTNVGIGTTAPSQRLHVVGNGLFSGDLTGNVVNATTQFNIGSERILSNPGSDNLFAGAGAGTNNTGIENSFFGRVAGASNTVGSGNTFVGFEAGRENTTGSNNSIFGSRAARVFGANANFNSIFGHRAGEQNKGSLNSFFGTGAGFSNQGGSSNTFVGHDAGNSNSTGSFNTVLGENADVTVSNITNATAIGSKAQVSQSNSLVLGSINGVNNATADSKVGIGTTAPLGRLQVVTTNDTNPLLVTAWDSRHFVIGGSASSGGIGLSYDQTNNVGYISSLSPNVFWRNLVLQSGGGNVGIGTIPDAKLSVNGTANKPGGGSWGSFSDERLKNIKGGFATGLNAVMKLQPLRYEYKNDNALNLKSEGEHIGFSAQAVQKIIPEAITTNDQGYLLVNNDPIMWTMLNAIKEQQAQIETLSAQNSAMSTRLLVLEKRLKRRAARLR